MTRNRPELVALAIADPPRRWAAIGFTVDHSCTEVGGVTLRLGAPGAGIVSWELRHADGGVDGLPSVALRPGAPPAVHVNGAVSVDHVVIVTPDFERTEAALDRAGLTLSRTRAARGGIRQGFRRLGPTIMEIVEAPEIPPGPARFWGLTITVADLEALATRLDDQLSEIRSAVQSGRRIATLRRTAGLTPALAFMDPEPE